MSPTASFAGCGGVGVYGGGGGGGRFLSPFCQSGRVTGVNLCVGPFLAVNVRYRPTFLYINI